MRAGGVGARDEQADAVGAAPVGLRVCLRARGDLIDDAGERDGAREREARGERLLLHVVAEHARVRGETGEREAVVRVDGDDLLLVRGELFGVALVESWESDQVCLYVFVVAMRTKGTGAGLQYFYGGEDNVRLGDDADDNAALLDGFGGVFDLEDAALWGAEVKRRLVLRSYAGDESGHGQGDGVVVILVAEHGEWLTPEAGLARVSI